MKLTNFPAWESTWPELPERTHLFNLEPIGLGTPFVESLTSYIIRLATEHQVTPSIIVSQDIASVSEKLVVDWKGYPELFKKSSISINGLSDTALEIADAMERLTGRAGLVALTMIRWRSVLAPTGLVRSCQAWCPVCFEEWRIKGKDLYEPLLWSLKETEICVDHFVPLEMYCPKCRRTHGPLTWHSTLGFCPWCQSWLGQSAFYGQQGRNPNTDVDDWLRFKSFGVAHFIGAQIPSFNPITSERFTRNIRFLRNNKFGGNTAKFSRVIHHCRDTIEKWSTGEQLPQLASILFLAYRFGILPQNLFLADLSDGRIIRIHDCSSQTVLRVKRKKRRMNRSVVESYLKLTLNAAAPPPSLRRICMRKGLSQCHVARVFPDLARALMDRFAQYVAIQKSERRARILEAIRKAVLQIKAKGQFPSLWRVKKELPNDNWMAEKWVRVEWKRIASEEGFVFRNPQNQTRLNDERSAFYDTNY
jgi:hypothetical protein